MAQKLLCVLCQRSEETKITGALSTKDEVTAHQNCLLFSSGIYCQASPQFDDLFGFSVEDVMEEVKRGSKLLCNRCKKKGATAGCEVKRCKKSYHYPCAVLDRAETFENAESGEYGLYCLNHFLKQQMKNAETANGQNPKVPKSKNPSEAGSSKVSCPTCEKTEGKISLESLSNGFIMSYCDKHAPPSHQRSSSDDWTAAGPSGCSSHFNSISSSRTLTHKRQLSFNGTHEEMPSKRKPACSRRIIDDSSDSDENELDSEMEMFAPLETDLDESENMIQEQQLTREDTEGPTSGNPGEDADGDEHKDEDEDESEPDSESLLPPAESCTASRQRPTTTLTLPTQTESTACPAVTVVKTEENMMCEEHSQNQSPVHGPDLQTAGPSVSSHDPPAPRSVTASPPCTSSAVCPASTETMSVPSSAPPSVQPSSDPHPSVNSASFWKSCNVAGCTQAIFSDFINKMKDVSSRIESDRASQEDYDLALNVMAASGKLAEFVTKQKEELQRKQTELQKAAAAMEDVMSALRR